MPVPCTICNHPDREPIDLALSNRRPLREIAANYRLTRTSLQRHRDNHLAPLIRQARQVAIDLQFTHLGTRLNQIHAITSSVLDDARNSIDHARTLQAVLRLERQVALALQLAHRNSHAAAASNTLAGLPADTPELRAIILRALEPFPEAFAALSQALLDHPSPTTGTEAGIYRLQNPGHASNSNKSKDSNPE